MKQSIGTQTPLGLLSAEVRNDILGRNGNVAQDLAMAKMFVGSMIGVLFSGLAAEGLMTGSGPSDPGKRAVWRQVYQPHSVRIGDLWYDVHRLGPLGVLASAAADMHDVAHTALKGDMEHAAAMFMHAVTQNFLDEGFMRGPADLIKAVEDSQRYGDRYVRDFLSSFVPYSVGAQQVARSVDPYSRQVRSFMDAVRNKLPWDSRSLLPRRGPWGDPLPNAEGLGHMTAIYMKHHSEDPVNIALLHLGIGVAPPQRRVMNVKLTDDQYDDYSRLAGRMAKQRLDVIVRSQEWSAFPPATQRDVIQTTIRQSRASAAGLLQMKYPDLAVKARDQKIGHSRGEDIKPYD